MRGVGVAAWGLLAGFWEGRLKTAEGPTQSRAIGGFTPGLKNSRGEAANDLQRF